MHPDRIHVDDVVAERVIDERTDEFCPGGQLRVVGGIHFQLIDLLRIFCVHGTKAGMEPSRALAGNHGPFVGGQSFELVRAADDFGDRHVADANPVGKPARVGHFVERVDVQRANGGPFAGRAPRVAGEVIGLRQFDFFDAAGVERGVVVGGDGIVGKKLRSRTTGLSDDAVDQQEDRADKRQHANVVENFRRHFQT